MGRFFRRNHLTFPWAGDDWWLNIHCAHADVAAMATPAVFFWFPSSSLGTAKPKLQLRKTGSWSFQVCIPKLELGNEYKSRLSVKIMRPWPNSSANSTKEASAKSIGKSAYWIISWNWLPAYGHQLTVVTSRFMASNFVTWSSSECQEETDQVSSDCLV